MAKKNLKPEPKSAEDWQKKAEEYLASWQRTQADFDNYRKRIEEHQKDFVRLAIAECALRIAPILDDFRRAFQAIPEKEKNSAWVVGMRHVENRLRAILESWELKPIEGGDVFDPRRHEAIATAPHPTVPEGSIIETLELGWQLGDKVLKPARVRVSTGPEKKETEGQEK